MNKDSILKMLHISLLAAILSISGAIKIPSFIPGTEFQLSAPLAVAICYAFGIKTYLIAGVGSSVVGLILGTQNPLNIFIAMSFRVVVAITMLALGRNKLTLLIAGPIASTAARLLLAVFINQGVYALILAALPGMIYTACAALPLGMLLARILKQTRSESNAV